MGRTARVFVSWALILSVFWIVFNWPQHEGGSLKPPFLEWAGFPWAFALWDGRRLEWFDPSALAADVVIGIVEVVALAGLCTWSPRRTA
jgi:hypothetical protein